MENITDPIIPTKMKMIPQTEISIGVNPYGAVIEEPKAA